MREESGRTDAGTSAIAFSEIPVRRLCSPGYAVEGRTLTETQDLGSDADNYDRGQGVTVHYDRATPTRMTIARS